MLLVFYLVSHKGFTIEQGVLKYLTQETKGLPYNVMQPKIQAKIQNFLRGLKVTYKIPNSSTRRTHRVIKLSEKDCYSTFTQDSDRGKQTIKITDYFLNSKKYTIRRPNLPTLHVNTKADGSEILLPVEVRKLFYICYK